MIEKHVLLTNLSHVTIGEVVTHACALVLVREEDPNHRGSHRCEIRGFGTEAAWPVFSVGVPTIDHELRRDPGDRLVLLRSDGRDLQNGPTIRLSRDDTARPVDVQTFEWDSDDNPRGYRFGELWSALEQSVARHWHAPYMPRLVHIEPEQAIQLPSRAAARSRGA